MTLQPEIPTTTKTHESGGELALTTDQQHALEEFFSFLCKPNETTWVLEGFSGCGKSTLVRTIIDQLPTFMQTARLLDQDFPHYDIELTATTNKAAENLEFITSMGVRTIHSMLGLRVQTEYGSGGGTKLIPKQQEPVLYDTILFIDEASFIDAQLLQFIFQLTERCKIVFIGDPAQLSPVKVTGMPPVFAAKFPTARLSEVVRQRGTGLHPIVDLSTQFRYVVETADWGKVTFKPDGRHVIHMDRDSFNEEVKKEFTRDGWKYRDSKVLAWTNKRVTEYNHYVNSLAKGTPHFQEGDYAVNNSFVTKNRDSLKTDQLVRITRIEDAEELGVKGKLFQVDGGGEFFMPDTLQARNDRIKQAKALDDWHVLETIDKQWIDLRQAFACTINKAQGSTYDKVYIDLDDVRRCNTGDQIARMMYVAVSRARHQVFLTGDLA